MPNKSQQLRDLGQSVWYDNIERRLLENGQLAAMIENGEIYGITSNPSIFNNAIAKSNDYDDDLIPLAEKGLSAPEIFETLAVEDIRAAADLFTPLYQRSNGLDGYVSLEVDPNLADDTDATCREAQRLWDLVDRPNLMVKIPATLAGIPAIERSIADGLNINITLIFSTERYRQVIDAYLSGLESRLEAGKPLEDIASVASFFISRIDTKTDGYLEAVVRAEGLHAAMAVDLMGQVAVANAKVAYQLFKEVFGSQRFNNLQKNGARLQRPLWASTSTKNANYSDVKYVEELIGPDTVNTLPPKTLIAFSDHGTPAVSIDEDIDAARQALEDLNKVGVSLDKITSELEAEGVASFSAAFADLLKTIEARRSEFTGRSSSN